MKLLPEHTHTRRFSPEVTKKLTWKDHSDNTSSYMIFIDLAEDDNTPRIIKSPQRRTTKTS